MKKLSVLLPVYNAEPFLDESITSILNQTYSDFEFFILDDCSTDNSLEIIQKYADKDKRIKILQNKQNKKQAACRNILLKAAKTEFIAWMDADDVSLPNRFKTQLTFLKNNPNVDIVGSQMNLFGTTSSTTHFPLSDYEIKSCLLLGSPLASAATVFRMKKIRKHKLLHNENLASAEDFQFLVDALPFVNFANIDKALYKYRIHSQQESIANRTRQQLCYVEIAKKHLEKLGIKTDKKILNSIIFPEVKNYPTEDLDSIVFTEVKNYPTEDLDSIIKVLEKTIQIKNYYNYPTLHKSVSIETLKKIIFIQIKIAKNQSLNSALEIFKKTIKENRNIDKNKLLQFFYSDICRKDGIRGKLFFIRNFGIKNYLKVKTW